MSSEARDKDRIVDLSIEVAAPASAVWRALTEAEELTRWFPPIARVEPGPGGTVFMSWGEGVEGTATIEVWEPNRALRLSESNGFAVDYFIHAQGEVTVFRVVHSGFGADASFDAQYEGTLEGWTYFLFNLKHYLERHAGQPRHLITVRVPVDTTREAAWRRLVGEKGLALSPSPAQKGDGYRMHLGNSYYTGRVASYRPARSFAGTVSELNDGLLFVELEAGSASWHCGFWLSVYGQEPDRDALRAALTDLARSTAAASDPSVPAGH
jgi:uncharacterized protein YndB with AHSA1/START domain